MSNLPYSPPPDVDRSGPLLASFWIPYVPTVILLMARFHVRIVRGRLGVDDWTMLAAWIFYTAAVSVSTAIVLAGGTRHINNLSLQQQTSITHLNIATQILSPLANSLAKAGVALLLPRILESTSLWRVWLLYIHIGIFFGMMVVAWGLLFNQCRPVQSLWSPAMLISGEGTCPNSKPNVKFGIAQGAFGAYLDFMLALFPITIVYKLNAPILKKIGICVILGLGVFAGVCAIMRSIQYATAFTATDDPTYNSYALFLWGGLEIPFVIIGGSIPPSMALWDRIVHGKSIAPGGPGASALLESQKRWWASLKSRSWKTQGSGKSTEENQASTPDYATGLDESIMMQKTVAVDRIFVGSQEPTRDYADSRWANKVSTRK